VDKGEENEWGQEEGRDRRRKDRGGEGKREETEGLPLLGRGEETEGGYLLGEGIRLGKRERKGAGGVEGWAY
jgi:hypothetical protein